MDEKNYIDILVNHGFECEAFIGKGTYGKVFKASRKNVIYAVKIIESSGKDTLIGENVKEARGPHLVKIQAELKKDKYYLYVMEYSSMGDISKIKEYSDVNMIFKNPFLEKIGDNLIRFLAKQLFYGIRTFFQGNFVHFDIKPNNILMFKNLVAKFIDFGFLTQISEKKGQKIIAGTPGYITPEYYYNFGEDSDFETLKKQDYFAIGATLYNIKYGKRLIEGYIRAENENERYRLKDYHYSITMDSIQRAINNIQSNPYQDEEFTEFLISLIQYNPEERADFEKIVRNKWLNKNTEEINKIRYLNNNDENHLLLELQKSDFLINYKNNSRKIFEQKNIDNNNKYKYNRRGKFSFGKKY